MIGIILASHGKMAEGILDTTKLFFNDQTQLEALTLTPEDNPDSFKAAMSAAVKRVDSGDGVLIFVDLLYGTPCNCAAQLLNPQVNVITGMNLPMVMEVLSARIGEKPDLQALIANTHDSIRNLKELLGR